MPGSTGAPYDLPYPVGTEQPFAHLDMKALAEAVAAELGGLESREQAFRDTAFGVYRNAGRAYVSGLMDWQQDTLMPGFAQPKVGSVNLANGVWTCGATGLYQISAKVRYRSNAAGHLNYAIDFFGNTEAQALLNGADVALYVSGGNWAVGPVLSGLAYCVAGRGYKVRGWSDASSNTIEVGSQHSYFTGVRVA